MVWFARLVLLLTPLLTVRPSSLESQGGSFTALVPIPAGTFTMGSVSGPTDERPEHRVELPAYSIERTPVTNRQFAEFLNATGSLTVSGRRVYDPDDGDARIHRKGNVAPAFRSRVSSRDRYMVVAQYLTPTNFMRNPFYSLEPWLYAHLAPARVTPLQRAVLGEGMPGASRSPSLPRGVEIVAMK